MQLLSSLIIILVILGVCFTSGADVIANHSLVPDEDEYILIAVLPVLGLAYWLNRRGYYRLAASVFLGITTAAVFLGAAHEQNLGLISYLTIVFVFGSLFLPIYVLDGLVLTSVAGIVLLSRLVPEVGSSRAVIDYFGFTLLVGSALHLVTRYRDLIEKDRQTELAASEERYRRLVETAPVAVTVHSAGKFVYANPTALRLLGATSPEQVLGRPLEDLVHPDFREIVAARDRQILVQGRSTGPLEQKLIRLDGQIVDVEVTGAPVLYQGQLATQTVFRDITERRQTEEALRQSERQFRALFETMTEGVALHELIYDSEGTPIDYVILEVNPAHEIQTGDSAATVRGRRWTEILGISEPPYFEIYKRVATTGEPAQFETYFEPLHRHFRISAFSPGTGQFATVFENITERKQAEEALRRRDTILEALAYISEQFLRSSDLGSSLPDALSHLGPAVGGSRVYIFENHTAPDGTLLTSQRSEWAAPGQVSQLDDPAFQNVPYIAAGWGRWAEALGAGRTLYGPLRSYTADERQMLQSQGILSLATVPIFAGEEWWGFLGFDDCEQEREWLPAEIEALRNVASTFGAALLRQRAEAAAREQHSLAEALTDMAAIINSTLQPDEVLERILVSIKGVLPHDAASLLLLEADHETVRVAGSHGYNEHADGGNISGKRFQISELADLENMIKDRRPLIMPDTRLDPRWKDVPETRWVRAHLGAPVMVEDQAIGFFNLDSATPGIYTPADAARLHAFADQAAIAIRNAQLFAAEQDQRALSDALRDMAAVLNSTLDLDEIFDRLLANIGRAVPHTASNITLVEGNRLRTVRVRGMTPSAPKNGHWPGNFRLTNGLRTSVPSRAGSPSLFRIRLPTPIGNLSPKRPGYAPISPRQFAPKRG